MKQYSRKEIRKRRNKLQQWTISICCLGLMVFIFAWVINIAMKGDKIQTSNSSEADKANVNASSVVIDDNSKNNSSSKSDKEKDSSSKTSSKDDKETDSKKDDIYDENDEDDFSDAVFIGDSRTVGLGMNTDRPKATFYAATGLNVDSIKDKATIRLDNGEYGTVFDALKQKQFKRVFISFGINELGWPYTDVFQEKYENLVGKVKEMQPNATIYIQSILPVSHLATKTNKVFTNENINKMNLYVQNVAANTGSIYLDVSKAVANKDGELPVEAATDGIHLIREYCVKWMDYIAENS